MRADIFHAIADPTRRDIIALLALQPLTPGALAAHFAMSRQAVSKHLQLLADCKLVSQQPKGREIYYQLETDRFKEMDQWLQQFRKCCESRLGHLDNLLFSLTGTRLV